MADVVLYRYQCRGHRKMALINNDMDALKKAIFSEVRVQHAEAGKLSDEDLNKLMFQLPDKIRLSYSGFLILKNIFTAYSFEIPETIKTRHQMGMSQMTYPYFFTKKRLILFSEMDAMMIKLHGGIEGFLETCYNIEH